MNMQIVGNAAGILNIVNKNDKHKKSHLEKLTSGLRLTGAKSDASGYAISERARVLVRALDQDIRNVQNGAALLKTAAGGVDSIVDELRNMKELALNSANDTNTDTDRELLDKILQQKIANINDMVYDTTYNGKVLLDGRYRRGYEITVEKQEKISLASVSSIELVPGKFTENIVSGFFPSATDLCRNSYYSEFSGKLGYDLPLSNQRVGYNFSGGSDIDDVVSEVLLNLGLPLDDDSAEVYATDIDFSNLYINGEKVTDPMKLHGQGFSLTCQWSSCHGHCAFLFDANLPKDSAVMLIEKDSIYDDYPPVGYIVGLNGAESMKDVENSMFNGIKKLTDEKYDQAFVVMEIDMDDVINETLEYMNRDLTPEQLYDVKRLTKEAFTAPLGVAANERASVAQVSLDSTHNIQIVKGADGKYSLRGLYFGYWGYDGGAYISDFEVAASTSSSTPGSLSKTSTITQRHPHNPLVIHHGSKANIEIDIYFKDMRSSAMGLDGVAVKPKEKAIAALDKIDDAIDYALDEATSIGAYYNRLEFTKSNLETSEENTRAAESVIRDADMAKEATEFAKYNVLSQASQAMLAQANQEFSGILSMLQ